jgi:fructokinase
MIATLGEALVDLIEQPDGRFGAVLGGSVFNVTLGLSLQGVPTTYLNPLSGDAFGRRFAAALDAAGGARAARSSVKPTSLAVVTVDAEGSPTYAFHREGVADRDADPAELAAALPRPLALLHSGGLALVPDDLPRTTAVIEVAVRRGALVSLDANVRLAAVAESARYLRGVWSALEGAQIVKLSLEDLQALGRGDDPGAAARELLEGATRLVALTFGADGAELVSRSGRVRLPAPRGLAVVDTVGAGDCFFSGLLAWLHRAGRLEPEGLERLDGAALAPALRHAIASASLDLLRAGCAPPTWAEAEAFARGMAVG